MTGSQVRAEVTLVLYQTKGQMASKGSMKGKLNTWGGFEYLCRIFPTGTESVLQGEEFGLQTAFIWITSSRCLVSVCLME